MKLLKENNIFKANFASSGIIVLFLSIALITTFIIFEYRNIVTEQKIIETEYIRLHKEKIKTAVENMISQFKMIKAFAEERTGPKMEENEIADTILTVIRTMCAREKSNTKTEYIFILKLYDINGGKEFASMLVNSNLPELVGKKIPDSYTGAHGKEFVKEMLPKLKLHGDAFVQYWFRKPGSDKPSPKITYWKLFPQWGWIIGKGIYVDDLETILSQKKATAFLKIKKRLTLAVGICLGFIAGAICLAYLFSRSIHTLFSRYKIKQAQYQRELVHLDLIINQAHDGIVVTDLEGTITHANKAWAKMHGYDPNEIIGRNLKIFHSLEQMTKEVMPCMEKVLQKGSHRCEIGHMHKDGSLFPSTMSSTLLTDRNNNPEGFLGVAIDISEIVKAKKKAEEANIAKSTFLANMSHEIRTPMNGIIGMTRLALETSLTHEQKKLLESVRASANGLLGLLNDILDFSKIEAGQLIIENHPFAPRKIIEDVIGTTHILAREKGLDISFKIEPLVPETLLGDRLRLSQILLNLIGNSIKFTRKGTISLQVNLIKKENNLATIGFSVTDTGIGINKTDQENIFDHFSQADTSTTRQYGGTGLGLSISRQICRMMGGDIRVTSEPGKGSVFCFTITCPIVEPKKITVRKKPKQKTDMLSSLTILLVEDNEINRELAQIVLKQQGHEVKTAVDGKKGLEAIADGEFDLILMDIQMPVMDGFTATKIIRNFEMNNTENTNTIGDLGKKLSLRLFGGHLHIIAMTANAMDGDREKCLAAGMDDYLTKPFVPDDIFNVIRRLGF